MVDGLPVSLPTYEEAVYGSWGQRIAPLHGPTQLLLASSENSPLSSVIQSGSSNCTDTLNQRTDSPPPYEERPPRSVDGAREGEARASHIALPVEKDNWLECVSSPSAYWLFVLLPCFCAYQCSSLSALRVFNERKFFGSYFLWMKPCNWEGKMFRKCVTEVWCAQWYWLGQRFQCHWRHIYYCPQWGNWTTMVSWTVITKIIPLWTVILCYMTATYSVVHVDKWMNVTPAELEDFTPPRMYAIAII